MVDLVTPRIVMDGEYCLRSEKSLPRSAMRPVRIHAVNLLGMHPVLYTTNNAIGMNASSSSRQVTAQGYVIDDVHPCDDDIVPKPPAPKMEPFTYEDRDQLRGKWVVVKAGYGLVQLTQFLAGSASGIYYSELLEDWLFEDTNEPVGKVVE